MGEGLGLFFTVILIEPDPDAERVDVLEKEFLIAGNPFHNSKEFDLTPVYKYLEKLPWETLIRYGGVVYEYVDTDSSEPIVKEISRFSGKHIYAGGYVADCEDVRFGLMGLAETHE